MHRRLAWLIGMAALAVAGLIISGTIPQGSVEAAKPVEDLTHTLAENGSACELATDVSWNSNAFLHKKGYYRLFLWGQTETGALRTAGSAIGEVAKGSHPIQVHQEWGLQDPGETYTGRVVFYSSRGKDGGEWGRNLMLDDQHFYLSC